MVGRVTIKDVAAKAGVSISTASKALNGTGSIGAETVKKVLDAARELDYQINLAGQALSRKGNIIGIVMPDYPHEVMDRFHDGLQQAMDYFGRFGMQFVYQTYHFAQSDSAFLQCVDQLAQQVNGLVVIPAGNQVDHAETLHSIQKKVPIITLQTAIDGFCPVASVTVNAKVVGMLAAEYLCTVAKQKTVAVIAGLQQVAIHSENIQGFKEVANANGCTVVAVRDTGDSMERARVQTMELVKEYPNLGGIFVTSYVSPAVCDCLTACGLQEHIAVVGVDLYAETAAHMQSGCLNALVFQNQELQAYTAVERMVDYLSRRKKMDDVLIKPELILKSNMQCYQIR